HLAATSLGSAAASAAAAAPTAASAATATAAAGTARPAGPTRAAGSAASAAAVAVTAAAPAATVAAVVGLLLRGLHLGEVGAGVALGHDLALVDPALHADAPERGPGLVEAVVDVGAHGVQRHAAVRVALGARHLRAAEAAGNLDLAALRARAHRARERALHRAAERDAVLQLLGDRLRDELRVELGALDLEDVDLDLLAGHPVEVLAQGVDLAAGLADHDPRTRGVDVDLHLVAVLADRDVAEPRVRELAHDVVADRDVLRQIVGEVALVEPVGLPVVDVAHAHRLGMNLLSHTYSFGVSVIVRWLVRLRMRVARPMARGRNRLSVGPSSAVTANTNRSSPISSWLCSALAIADSSTLLQSRATARGVCARIARASCTDLPRMWSHTRRALRAEVRTYLAWARTSTVSPSRRAGARRAGAASVAGSSAAPRPRRPRRPRRRPVAGAAVSASGSSVFARSASVS